MILNAIVHVLIAIILNIKSLNADFVRIAYTILRFLSGHTSNNYTQAVVLAGDNNNSMFLIWMYSYKQFCMHLKLRFAVRVVAWLPSHLQTTSMWSANL
jgi:hypothetical protein